MNPFRPVGKAFPSFLEATGKLAIFTFISVLYCVRELGASAMLITHDMASTRKFFDHIAMLYKGKIIWIRKSAESDSSGEPHLDQFIHGRADEPIKMELRRL